MCCGWGSNRTNAGTADTCLPNGLCQAPVDTWRESCTDPTWQAPECVKLFVNGTGYGGEPQVNDGKSEYSIIVGTGCRAVHISNAPLLKITEIHS